MNKLIPSIIEDNGEYYIHFEEYKTLKELVEHYEHLYSEVKKQKDDVVEYIKGAIENDDIEELKEGRHLLLWNEDLDILLRMLGETNETDNM